jgi:hypothetical protein
MILHLKRLIFAILGGFTPNNAPIPRSQRLIGHAPNVGLLRRRPALLKFP